MHGLLPASSENSDVALAKIDWYGWFRRAPTIPILIEQRVSRSGEAHITLSKRDGGAMARDGSLHCELEKSKDKDENGNQVTTIKCHGELVSNTAGEIKELVRPLIPLGGRIIIDLGDVKHLNSAGLGALVGLKASAIKQGPCRLELVNMTPGVLELLRITHLTQMFSS